MANRLHNTNTLQDIWARNLVEILLKIIYDLHQKSQEVISDIENLSIKQKIEEDVSLKSFMR